MTADEYVRRVNYWLTDLPWGTKRELLSELRSHLSELPEGTDLAALGTPEQYAADMRAAAGLERRRGVIAFLRARRPRNLLLTALALTVIGLAIGAVVWIDNYEPIVFAGGTQLPLDSKPTPGAAGVTVVFRKGHPFEYGITIHNDDRFTVRVLGVSRDVADFFKGRLLMSKDQRGLSELPLERFHPFDMKPGSFRWLVFKGHLACTTGMAAAGGAVTREAFAIRYSFLWRTATAWIPLTDPVTIVFSKEGCPPAKNPTVTP